jgi:malate dehydrogenase (oxaloacetate-decarboxylating)(NADP+)
MSSRDDILASIRANLPRVERPLPQVPLFDSDPPASPLSAFKDSLHRMGGMFLEPPTSGDALGPIRTKIADAKIVCSTVPEIAGNRDITGVGAPQDLADVDFAIVRASFAVAETGSLLLSDADLRVNAVAYLAQHLIVLLDPADIVVNLHHAYRRPEFSKGHYASFHTGPSATADIEGVLIHGAQGVRSLSVLPIARATGESHPLKPRRNRMIPTAKIESPNILHGVALLNDPVLNKGTAFSPEERSRYRLEGFLPPAVEDLDRQVERVMEHLDAKPNDLERYVYLIGLSDRNETLFYRAVMSDPARFIPILYDPTVADACLAFGQIYRRARGMYITREMKGRIAEVLRNWPQRDIRFICVSTGGRILGLGDIGANGMGIPIGKLQLYTACAAVPPECLLPVLLDIGTTNEVLRADPLYLGSREKPPSDEELDELVEEFVQAVQQVFPECCIHFEDWKGTDAIRLLDRYADKILCYNDDIQGTASVALAGLTTALQIIDAPLTDQRILFLGAGSAGIGIAKLIAAAMQAKGLSQDEARSRISMFDVDGLLEPSRANLSEAQKVYAHKAAPSKDLVKTIEMLKPTVLIGVSTKGGAFNQRVVEAMSKLNERPIIFALSNPTDKAECTAEQAYTWSKGKALFAAGVQFPDVRLNGGIYHPGQANNFYIFPAVGLATYAARPRRLTDECFIVAAQASADQISPGLRAKGMLFPGQANILETEVTTATRVAEFMFDAGLAQVKRPRDIRAWIEGQLYKPQY